jgi:penicillin-binding protein 1A
MQRFLNILRWFLILCLVGMITGAIAGYFVYRHYAKDLPDVETLKDTRLQTPLRIYSRDGDLIAEHGEKKRIPVPIENTPARLIDAFLVTEDQRFYYHIGVDFKGILRAIVADILTNSPRQGASTITMQVARNFFLTRERTISRKLREIILAIRIEQVLSKDEILELYLNKIFLGHRAYGIGAAAQVYYGKDVNELTLPEMAIIAGLPKAPSTYNPISHPERAKERRRHVLRRLYVEEVISEDEYRSALDAPVATYYHGSEIAYSAPYVAEIGRRFAKETFGEKAFTDGYELYLSMDSASQRSAIDAMHKGLQEYDRRHGYKGPISQVSSQDKDERIAQLNTIARIGSLQPAIVIEVKDKSATLLTRDSLQISLEWTGISWAKKYISDNRYGNAPKQASDVLSQGDIVYVYQEGESWQLGQLPEVQGAFVAMDPYTGYVKALVGGYDYFESKFNRATQALRQPGSNIKPFVYAAAFDKGFTPASLINDAPISFYDQQLEAEWRPENAGGKFRGPTRLRVALRNSTNLVSVRLLEAMGIEHAINYLESLGFERSELPRNATLALGTMSITPLELVSHYATLANGGYKVEPTLIDRVTDTDGNVLYQSAPVQVCTNCLPYASQQALCETAKSASADDADDLPPVCQSLVPEQQRAKRVMAQDTAFLIDNLLKDVVRRGTATRAKALKRNDLAGKTGTTNNARDAWFSGYTGGIVATAWVGFDDHSRSLGRREYGSKAALPIWMHYMKQVVGDGPEVHMKQPSNVVSVKIDPQSGLRASDEQENAIFEYFNKENLPEQLGASQIQDKGENTQSTEAIF